jgi:RNA polymerase sigma factor (sigma-70 family)
MHEPTSAEQGVAMHRHGTSLNVRRWLLLERCLPMLRSYVRRLVKNEETANEIIQEISVSILSSPSPDETGRFAAWSRGVARHVVSRELRRRQRHRAELEHDLETFETLDTIDLEHKATLTQTLSRAAGKMDRNALLLLIRRYVLEETPTELALDFARTPAALRMQLMRLRSLFRETSDP